MNTTVSLFSPLWIIWLIWSGLAMVVSWYGPGSAWVSQLKLKSVGQQWLLSWLVGLVAWAGQGVLVGYLHLRWLTVFYCLAGAYWLWRHRQVELHRWQQLWARAWTAPVWLKLMAVVGTWIQVWPLIGSGWLWPDGIHFYRINAYDSVMHLAYIQELAQTFPPREPGAVWLALTNYHYWSDLVMAEVTRIWQVPINLLFFQIMPIFLSVMTALGLYYVVRLWGGTRRTAAWAWFFLYGAGELTYALLWLLQKNVHFETSAIDNGAMQFLNMPHCFAKAIFMADLISLVHWQRRPKHWGWLLTTVALQASLVGFKIYFGMFAALGLGVITAWLGLSWAWQHRRHLSIGAICSAWWPLAALLGLTAALMAAIFLPTNQHAGGLIYSPLEWPKLFLGASNLNFQTWWLRRQVYEAAGNTRNLLILDGLAIAICLACVHGTRLLGLWPRRWWRVIGWPLFWYLTIPTLAFTWLGLFTLQESGLFNVFNFFAVSTIPLAIASAWWCDTAWSTGQTWRRVLVAVVVVLTVPRVIHTTWFYTDTYRRGVVERRISLDELATLNYLRHNIPAQSLIQASPLNQWDLTTPYVAYYANQPSYLTGVGMMDTHNQPVQKPAAELKQLFLSADGLTLKSYLRDRGVTHLFLTTRSEEQLAYPLTDLGSVVFANPGGVVIQLN